MAVYSDYYRNTIRGVCDSCNNKYVLLRTKIPECLPVTIFAVTMPHNISIKLFFVSFEFHAIKFAFMIVLMLWRGRDEFDTRLWNNNTAAFSTCIIIPMTGRSTKVYRVALNLIFVRTKGALENGSCSPGSVWTDNIVRYTRKVQGRYN